MRPVLISQRVFIEEKTGERRDCLDQRWNLFLKESGLFGIPVPNSDGWKPTAFSGMGLAGVLLTGGNDLAKYGGDAPERDRAERELIRFALATELPLIGVCRGMQMLQDYFGVPLIRVEGHVQREMDIKTDKGLKRLNSFHSWGANETVPELAVWAKASDGVIKAVRHTKHKILGVMWHPERFPSFREEDQQLFRSHFQSPVERAAS